MPDRPTRDGHPRHVDDLRTRLAARVTETGPDAVPVRLGPLKPLIGGWDASLFRTTATTPTTGASSETWVLKLYSPDARGREQASREWRALTHLRAAGHPVPRPILWGSDARDLGRPFVVMEHIDGVPLMDALESADDARRRRLTEAFVGRLVDLHSLDPLGLDPASGPAGPFDVVTAEIAGLERDLPADGRTDLTAVVHWLRERSGDVPCDRPVILHRDHHPWNVLVDREDRLWVLDWDWGIGDRRFDLAWTCTLLARSGLDDLADAVHDGYAEATGTDLDGFAFFEVMATLRWVLTVLPAAEEDAARPEADRSGFAAFVVAPLERARRLLTQHTGIDVLPLG